MDYGPTESAQQAQLSVGNLALCLDKTIIMSPNSGSDKALHVHLLQLRLVI